METSVFTDKNIDLEELKKAFVGDIKIDLIDANYELKKALEKYVITSGKGIDGAAYHLKQNSRFLYFYMNGGDYYTFRKNTEDDADTFKRNKFKEVKLNDFFQKTKILFKDIWT